MKEYEIKYLNKIPAFNTVKKKLKLLNQFERTSRFRLVLKTMLRDCNARVQILVQKIDLWKWSLVLNATSQQAKKIGYPSIISLAMIIIGSYILFNGLVNFVSVCLFILDSLLIFAIFSSLNRLHKLRTPNDSLESKNGPKYTPLISDV